MYYEEERSKGSSSSRKRSSRKRSSSTRVTEQNLTVPTDPSALANECCQSCRQLCSVSTHGKMLLLVVLNLLLLFVVHFCEHRF